MNERAKKEDREGAARKTGGKPGKDVQGQGSGQLWNGPDVLS